MRELFVYKAFNMLVNFPDTLFNKQFQRIVIFKKSMVGPIVEKHNDFWPAISMAMF